MAVRFLLDENLSPRLKSAVLRLEPRIDILRVGELDAPSYGTPDPDILRYLELNQRILVTDNRKSIPGHVEIFWAEGGHIWGLLWLRPNATLDDLAQSLLIIWGASTAEEWVDRFEWIPL